MEERDAREAKVVYDGVVADRVWSRGELCTFEFEGRRKDDAEVEK